MLASHRKFTSNLLAAFKRGAHLYTAPSNQLGYIQYTTELETNTAKHPIPPPLKFCVDAFPKHSNYLKVFFTFYLHCTEMSFFSSQFGLAPLCKEFLPHPALSSNTQLR